MARRIRDDEVVTLWTIQELPVFEKLEKTGAWMVESSKFLFDQASYEWMKKQMIKRGIKPSSHAEVWPIWAWYQYEGRRGALDLRGTGFAKKGTSLVRLEIEVPRSKVLLSDFTLWHSVLNEVFIGENKEEEEAFWEYGSTFPREVLETSWEKIFQVIEVRSNPWLCEHPEWQSIQATFWKLEMSQVKNVKFFTAR